MNPPMKYRELFHYDSIEAIVQLRAANELQEARNLVDSYVISPSLSERLTEVVLPQLQFVRDEDNKGVLIVGNYGSGKSHLLSVLSAVAEHAELVSRLRDPHVAKVAEDIAGRFRVLRLEIGTTKMSLRDILCAHMEDALARAGVEYRFPSLTEVSGYKRAFEDMMAAFGAKYPDKGFLLVVDELLDYLRQCDDHGVAQALSFLREIGESCRNLRLRFVAGVQETLFDNPRFQFVNDSLRRVEARFRQIQIVRDDVRYVIKARLLRKDDTQRQWVRDYLRPFTKYYGNMNERLETFVDLFPIHPDFIDVFERVPIVEKRTALTTVSVITRQLQDEDVPSDRPGVVSYDRFWESIVRNPTYRTVPTVRPVIDCAQVLEERVRQGITLPDDQRLALRIVYGLSLQRLAVGDVERPIGVTPAQLRDGLCLYDPGIEGLSDDAAEDLRTAIEASLHDIVRTVSGQFISVNRDNDQYYIDIHRTEDYDALIAQRAESLSDELRDRYWFEALKRVMECSDVTLVTGFRIWEHEIEWKSRRASRRGYLLFGAPNERPTAQPPRDFYLYFMQPWKPPRFKDEKRSDELFFRLTEKDGDLFKSLDAYAAASELGSSASGSARATYEKKASDALRGVVEWIRKNLASAVNVTYQGRAQNLGELLKKGKVHIVATPRLNMRDVVNALASYVFEHHFYEDAPEYPTFPALITSENRNRAAADALKALRGQSTRNGRAVLEALQLLDGDLVRPKASPYAKKVLELLHGRAASHVINRAELLGMRSGVEYDTSFRLEPEWFVVVLAALVHAGEITLAMPGRKFDAGDMDALATTPIDDLIAFRHVERPKGWNRALLVALFELVGLPGGQGVAIVEGTQANESFQNLQTRVEDVQSLVLRVERRVRDGLVFWGTVLLEDTLTRQYLARIDTLRAALDTLRNVRGVGQLKNLGWDEADARARAEDLALVRELDALVALVAEHSPAASWMTVARAALRDDHPWVAELERRRSELMAMLLDPARRTQPSTRVALANALTQLQEQYVTAYVALHQDARMGTKDARRRDALRNDPRMKRLERLASLPVLPASALERIRHELDRLRECSRLVSADLRATPVCPHCEYRPVTDTAPAAPSVLPSVDSDLDRLTEAWTRTLVESLDTPTARRDRAMLDGRARGILQVFVEDKALPEEVDDGFVEAAREVLAGIEAVTLDPYALARDLAPGGLPVTLDELQNNFERHIAALTRGKEPGRVRVIVGSARKGSV